MLILNYSWAVWLAWALAIFFVADGVANLVGPRRLREALAGWGFPAWFRFANGILQVVTGLMIAWYPARIPGLMLAAVICVAIWITLIVNRDWEHLPPSLILFALIWLTAWGLRLI